MFVLCSTPLPIVFHLYHGVSWVGYQYYRFIYPDKGESVFGMIRSGVKPATSRIRAGRTNNTPPMWFLETGCDHMYEECRTRPNWFDANVCGCGIPVFCYYAAFERQIRSMKYFRICLMFEISRVKFKTNYGAECLRLSMETQY